MPTGQTFHRYINPERDMPAEAFAVHGLSREFLPDKPLFAEVVEEFLEFIADAPLVIHNASFESASSMPNSIASSAADRPRTAGGHAAAGAAQASRGLEPARRSLLALRHRQFPPHQARRAARRGTSGRGLYRSDRCPAVATGPGAEIQTARRSAGDTPRRQRGAAGAAGDRGRSCRAPRLSSPRSATNRSGTNFSAAARSDPAIDRA